MKINYDSVRRDARRLGNLAEECDAAARVCRDYQSELPQFWKGDAAERYIAGLAQLRQKNTALSQEISRVANMITMVANEMEEEDRKLAAKIAARTQSASSVGNATTTSQTRGTTGIGQQNQTTTGKGQTSSQAVSDVISVAKDSVATIASTLTGMVGKLFGKR